MFWTSWQPTGRHEAPLPGKPQSGQREAGACQVPQIVPARTRLRLSSWYGPLGRSFQLCPQLAYTDDAEVIDPEHPEP